MAKPRVMEKPICSTCQSDDVLVDAWAAWNANTQAWELDNTFDNAHCNKCDGECSLEWVPA